MRTGQILNKVFLYIILSAFVIIFIYPFLWMIFTALKADTEILDNPLTMPGIKYFQENHHYSAVFLDKASVKNSKNIVKKYGTYFERTEEKVIKKDGWYILENSDEAVLKKGGAYFKEIGENYTLIKMGAGKVRLIPTKSARNYAIEKFKLEGKFKKGMIADFSDGKMVLLAKGLSYTQVIPFKKIRLLGQDTVQYIAPEKLIKDRGKYYYNKKEVEVLRIKETEELPAKFIEKRGRHARVSVKEKVRLKDYKKRRFMWENFAKAWKQGQYFNYYLFNSVFTSVISTILQVTFAAMAAFAFARFHFKGVELVFTLFLSTMMIPSQMLLIPNYIIVSKMGAYNTYWGIILPWLANVTNIFLLRQFFKSIPDDLFDSVRIDGGSVWAGFWHIALPLSKPILVTTALFSFIFQWNSFIWILIITNDPKMQTLQVGLSNFSQAFGTDWNLLMAASTIVILPLVVMYFFVQRRIIESLARSGLKG